MRLCFYSALETMAFIGKSSSTSNGQKPNRNWVVLLIIALVVGLLFASCKSAESHIAKAIYKDPSLLQVRKLEFVDTLFTQSLRTTIAMPLDSLGVSTAVSNGIEIKTYVYDTLVITEVVCPPDTHIVTNTEYITQVEYVEPDSIIQYGRYVILIAFILAILRMMYRRDNH